MIDLQNITYTYPHSEQPALIDLNLHIAAGEFCAVVGPNMAGKSTLCYAITGFVPHFYKGNLQGKLQVAGLDISAATLAEVATQVGLVFANPFNQITGARFSVREEIAFGLENMGVARDEMLRRTEETMHLTGLSELAERSPYQLSGGQQQRLALASILVMQPQVIVLDEPTSQLDPLGKREVFEVLDRLTQLYETTIVLVEHELEWIANFADRVLVMENGRIVSDGDPQMILVDMLLENIGVGQTQYTQAARRAAVANIVADNGRLPVTLDQAVNFFSDTV